MARRDRKRKPPLFMQEQKAEMKEMLKAEQESNPLPDPTRKRDVQELRESVRMIQPDERELLDSLLRLEQAGIVIAVRDKPPAFRVITNEAERGLALAAGLSLWTPRDMFEYIHLPLDQRLKLASFKRIFQEAVFDWEKFK